MSQHNPERGVERQDKDPKPGFEKQPWDKKTGVEKYAKQEQARFVGRLFVSSELTPKDKKKEEPKDKEQRELFAKALGDQSKKLDSLHGKQEALDKFVADTRKGNKEFRETEKLMEEALKPFNGKDERGRDKREMLFAALDEDLNPNRNKKEKPLEPKDKQKIIEELDVRLAETREAKGGEEDIKPLDHMGAYVFLLQEHMFSAEDQLNGTREQALKNEVNLVEAEGNTIRFLRENPAFTGKLTSVVTNGTINESQKISAIEALLTSVDDPKYKEVLDNHGEALRLYAELGDLERDIANGARAVLKMKEFLSRAKEKGREAQALLEIEDITAEQQQESAERHDVVAEN
jgi:hypothetical protein